MCILLLFYTTIESHCAFFYSADSTCDLPIDPLNENQYIVWGVGGLGETAFRHFLRAQSQFKVLFSITDAHAGFILFLK